jgi:uncharacterized protein YjhX (UPF0386 family)
LFVLKKTKKKMKGFGVDIQGGYKWFVYRHFGAGGKSDDEDDGNNRQAKKRYKKSRSQALQEPSPSADDADDADDEDDAIDGTADTADTVETQPMKKRPPAGRSQAEQAEQALQVRPLFRNVQSAGMRINQAVLLAKSKGIRMSFINAGGYGLVVNVQERRQTPFALKIFFRSQDREISLLLNQDFVNMMNDCERNGVICGKLIRKEPKSCLYCAVATQMAELRLPKYAGARQSLVEMFNNRRHYHVKMPLYTTHLRDLMIKTRMAMAKHAKRILQAMQCIQRHGFVYTDMKLENILYDERTDTVVLADLGGVYHITENPGTVAITFVNVFESGLRRPRKWGQVSLLQHQWSALTLLLLIHNIRPPSWDQANIMFKNVNVGAPLFHTDDERRNLWLNTLMTKRYTKRRPPATDAKCSAGKVLGECKPTPVHRL